MTFRAPSALWLLVLPVLVVAAYVLAQLARRHAVVRFTNLDLLASVAPKRPGWRRHVAAGALLLALVSMVLSLAHPARAERVPRDRATVILALDVSASMAADDVQPSRLAAAQAAAERFAKDLPPKIRLGLIAFAGSAQVRVPPTTDRDAVVRSIETLDLLPRTAIGEAIYTALDVIASDPVQGSGRTPAHIVLMSDGTTTSGRPNDAAARAAAEAKVPVTTIAYGTDQGTVVVQGETVQVPVDRAALKAIADETGGRFFEAASAGQLRQVYSDIGHAVGFTTTWHDISARFTAAALVLTVLAAAASLVWMGRLP
ncbi:MAG TPA: VWA domain-containing protein [Acidimicrobiales bacterium]|nr:VWA domain-containing protein [Acidimicrobiales bacterium]